MKRNRTLIISFKSISVVIIASVILSIAVIASNKDEIISAIRYVRHFEFEELETRIKMQLDRAKYDFLALSNPNPAKLPIINLHIAPSDLRKIDVFVKNIGVDGSLQDGIQLKKKWSPVRVMHENNTFSGRIRIRGNQATHWISKKKSWRIKFKKESLFQRRRSIHLIIIKDKMIEIEQAAYQVAKKNGLLVPDSGFMLVTQNNVDMGLYFWTEHFDKVQLERRKLPEGEFFTGDDAHLEKIAAMSAATGNPAIYGLNPAAYKTLIHKKGKVAAGTQQRWHDFLRLLATDNSELINNQIEEFLDVKKFAVWNSLIFIFGNSHGQSVDNLRWFYNPTTGLFEPILWDIALGSAQPIELDKEFYNPVVTKILSSQKVREARNKSLYKLVHEDGDYILSTLEDTYQRIEPYLYRGVEPIDQDLSVKGNRSLKGQYYTHENRYKMMQGNLRAIESWLTEQRVFGESSFLPQTNGGDLKVELVSQGVSSLELNKLEIEPIETFTEEKVNIKFSLNSSAGENYILQPIKSDLSQNHWEFLFSGVILIQPRFGNLTANEKKIWTLTASINGPNYNNTRAGNIPALVKPTFKNSVTGKLIPADFIRITKVAVNIPTGQGFGNTKDVTKILGHSEVSHVSTNVINSKLRDFLVASRLPFRVKNKDLILPKGQYRIFQHLILPKGYRLVLNPGVKIFIAPNINILTRDPVEFRGTIVNPVIIDRLDQSSAWGIIGIISAKGLSILNHVTVRGGGAGTKTFFNGLYFTGQLNFFNSDVEITNSHILDSQGEDGLNIKNSRFTLKQTNISNNRADGFDGDWTTGTILSSKFLKNGNDGLDFSGSKVVVIDTLLSGMGDKAVSAGEQSQLDIINSRIRSSQFGVTSKDLSRVRLYAVSVRKNKIGISSYRKKPVFGGGFIEVFGGLIWQNKNDFLVDSVSQVYLEGVGITATPSLRTVKTNNIRVGQISEIYKLDKNSFPVPTATKMLPSIFQAGPKTSGRTIGGTKLPDLSRHPVGLIRSIN